MIQLVESTLMYILDIMSEETTIELNGNTIMGIYESLEIGKEYAQEVLQNHLVTLGETTRKNKMTADLIRGDIEKMEFSIHDLKDNYEYVKRERDDFNRRYC